MPFNVDAFEMNFEMQRNRFLISVGENLEKCDGSTGMRLSIQHQFPTICFEIQTLNHHQKKTTKNNN